MRTGRTPDNIKLCRAVHTAELSSGDGTHRVAVDHNTGEAADAKGEGSLIQTGDWTKVV